MELENENIPKKNYNFNPIENDEYSTNDEFDLSETTHEFDLSETTHEFDIQHSW